MTSGDARRTLEGGASGPGATASRRFVPCATRFGLCLAGAGILVFLLGFFWFATRVPRVEVALEAKADAIVALTGGASRVVDAVELLAAGRGQRLLITGVNRTTNSGELARRVPEYERLVACCIDLDHTARNTVGNAIEARRWTLSRGFRSLVVVTSSYHMPRAMAELSYRLPGVQLIPYPVVTEARAEPWWQSPFNAKLLLTEYVKYMVAVVRMRIEAHEDETETAATRHGTKG